jgi:hypothetical protein
MTPRTYARTFLLLPMLVGTSMPVSTHLLNGISSAIAEALPLTVKATLIPWWLFLMYLLVGSWLAVLPYGLFAATALAYLWHRDGEVYFRLAKIAPIAFLPFFGIFLYFSQVLGRIDGPVQDDIAGIAFWCLITLPFSYAYVALFHIVGLLLPRPAHTGCP